MVGGCGRLERWLRFSGREAIPPQLFGSNTFWHQLCQTEAFSLFCAYPKSGFTEDSSKSIREICEAHSRII